MNSFATTPIDKSGCEVTISVTVLSGYARQMQLLYSYGGVEEYVKSLGQEYDMLYMNQQTNQSH